jgi:hypothetical protein
VKAKAETIAAPAQILFTPMMKPQLLQRNPTIKPMSSYPLTVCCVSAVGRRSTRSALSKIDGRAISNAPNIAFCEPFLGLTRQRATLRPLRRAMCANDPGSGVVDHPSSRRSANSGAFANEVVRQRQRAWQQQTTIRVPHDPVC